MTEGLTIEKLMAAMEALKGVPPDPLSGVTALYAADGMFDAAVKIASEAAKGFFGRHIRVERRRHLPAGRIVGIRGHEIVLIMEPPADVAG